VIRPSMIRVQAYDREGVLQDFEANGLYAVCIQHEMDHLIGKLFIDRMADMSTLTQLEEFDAYWREESAPVI
jgi:peptide deformylase